MSKTTPISLAIGSGTNDAAFQVAVVVVTHCRSELLQLCLRGIAAQTMRPTRLIIVNNASADDTEERLRDAGFVGDTVAPLSPSVAAEISLATRTVRAGTIVEYLRLRTDVGAGGGYHIGVAQALGGPADWIWVMDDDVEATPNALGDLLRFRDRSECLHPRKVYADGSPWQWEGWFSEFTGRTVFFGDRSFAAGKSFCQVNYANFEGMLVSRRVAEHVGLPDRRCFIANVDLIYGWLAQRYTDVLYVNVFGLIRNRPADKLLAPLALYLNMRDHFVIIDHLRRAGQPALRLWMFAGLKFAKEVLENLVQPRAGQRTRAVFWGFVDGVRGRFGRPAPERWSAIS